MKRKKVHINGCCRTCFRIAGVAAILFYVGFQAHLLGRFRPNQFLGSTTLFFSQLDVHLRKEDVESQKRQEESKRYSYGGPDRAEMALKTLPPWVADYVNWHAIQRASLPGNETKFIVSSCFIGQRCGGTSDRLQTLPFLLLLANMTERVLVLKWTKPHPLEEFLLPPLGGLDWRVRDEDELTDFELLTKGEFSGWCGNKPRKDGKGKKQKLPIGTCVERLLRKERQNPDHRRQLLPVRVTQRDAIREAHAFFQAHAYQNNSNTSAKMHGKEPWQGFNTEIRAFFEFFGEIFRLLFQPSPPVATAFRETMNKMGLEPGKFVGAHVRARCPWTRETLESKVYRNVTERDMNPKIRGSKAVDKPGGLLFEGETKNLAIKWASNAVICASNLSPGLPVYLASDSNDTVSHLVRHGVSVSHDPEASQTPHPEIIVVGKEGNEPLHIDYEGFEHNSTAEDFYSGFVDLLMLGSAKCVAYGMGGYGRFGASLSGGSPPCVFQHRSAIGKINLCRPVQPVKNNSKAEFVS